MSTSFKNVTPTGPGGTATLLIVLSFTGFLLLTQSLFCLLYTSPSPRDVEEYRMPSSA